MNDQKTIQTRIPGVDLVETIAMIMVVGYHCGLMPAIFSCCVPLFFMANGYLLLNKPLNLQKHIRKTGRLFLLTLFWGIFKVLLFMPIKGQRLSARQFIEVIAQLRSGWVNSLWFLMTLTAIYVLFPLLKQTFDNDEKSYLFFTGTVGVLTIGWKTLFQVSMVVMSLLRHTYKALPGTELIEHVNPISNLNAFGVLYFCLGGLLFRYQERILAVPATKRRRWAIGLMLVCCLFQEGINLFHYLTKYMVWDGVFDGYDMLFCLVNTICIFVLALDCRGEKTWVSLISANTFGIYILHEIPVYAYRRFRPEMGKMIYFWSALLPFVSFGFGLGMTLLLKKNRFTAKLFL